VLELLLKGDLHLFSIMLFVMIFSLTMHEFGHALMVTKLGDNTALLAGRLTLNPVSHIDVMGLLMLVMLSFGYAKPVPFTPRNIKQRWGQAAIAAAGPGMNLILAFVAINVYFWGVDNGSIDGSTPLGFALQYMAIINLLLMLFNLLPIGLLDGHYIMSWLLPPRLSTQYDMWNARYGNLLFLGLIILSVAGLPIFRFLTHYSYQLASWLVIV
jgi:Zn-dependent protease